MIATLPIGAARLDLPMAVGDALERKTMAHVRAQQPRIHEPRDARENLPRAFRLDLLPRRHAHELVVDRDVAVEQRLAAIAGVASRESSRAGR